MVRENVTEYDLELARYRTGFVDGLKQRMEEGGSDKCYGFVLGTRQGDPNCGVQTSFTPSRYCTLQLLRISQRSSRAVYTSTSDSLSTADTCTVEKLLYL